MDKDIIVEQDPLWQVLKKNYYTKSEVDALIKNAQFLVGDIPSVPSYILAITKSDINRWNNGTSSSYSTYSGDSIPASYIELDSTHRFVSDSDINNWNNKSALTATIPYSLLAASVLETLDNSDNLYDAIMGSGVIGLVLTRTSNGVTWSSGSASSTVITYSNNTLLIDPTSSSSSSSKGDTVPDLDEDEDDNTGTTISPSTIAKISIKTNPTTTTYTTDSTKLDLSGLVLNVLYDDFTIKEVSTGYTTSFSDFTVGTKNVTIKYGTATTLLKGVILIFKSDTISGSGEQLGGLVGDLS